jgi:hypothetical protein
MTKASDVLSYLRPEGGWVIWGEEFDSIRYDEGVVPVTKAQFDKGVKDYESWKAKNDAAKQSARQAILDRLGLTADELKTILG